MPTDNYGDQLARSVSDRIGTPVANEAALSSLPNRLKKDGRVFLAKSEGTLWWCDGNGSAATLRRVSAGGAASSTPISLYLFREVDANSDVGNTVANGGILASDTTPILRGNAAETQEISWATGNTDPIAVHLTLPANFSGATAATIDLWVNSGTTDAATFTVESGWDGGALVSDSADDSGTKSATTHKITATIAAADIPDTAQNVTIILTPAAHATNAIQLLGARLNYALS